jgi:outer membrane protein assembly factor BamB
VAEHPSAFRHDPSKNVLATGGVTGSQWTHEPALCGYRRFTYFNQARQQRIAVPVSSTPAAVANVGPIVASDDGYVRFFDPALTRYYWEHRLNSSVYASLVLDTGRKRFIVAATSGLVACFDLRGRPAWSLQFDAPVFATPAVLPDSDIVVFAAFSSRCFGVDLDSGQIRFSQDVPKPWSARFAGSAAHRDPYASPAGTAEGNVVLCCGETVLCLTAAGKELWRCDTGHSIKSSPVALHQTGEIAVCSVDGSCRFLDCATGTVTGEVFLGAKVTASPAVSGDVLAIGTVLGTALGLHVRTRTIQWTSTGGGPRDYTSFTITPAGDFVATAAGGNVVCLRRDDGRFLWETSQVLGLPDHEPAMNITPVISPDGSMYCASYSGFLYRFLFEPIQPTDQAGEQ